MRTSYSTLELNTFLRGWTMWTCLFQKERNGGLNHPGFFLLKNNKEGEGGKPEVIIFFFLVCSIVVCEGQVIEMSQLNFFQEVIE